MKRLTPATLTMVMFGILGLLVFGYVAKSLLAVTEKKVTPAMRDIPMAITDVAPGTILTDKHLGLGKIPVSDLSREMLLTNRVIVGRVVRVPLKAAEPIKANQLYQHGERVPLELTNSGMRAVTVQVTDGASMVDGMVKPHDHVDVLFTAMSGGTGVGDLSGGLVMRLFEGVKILTINGSSTQGSFERGNNFVTLELTEPQANVLVLARDKGKITLTYNPKGKGNGGLAWTNTERITFYEILGLTPAPKPKEPFMTEIYRGPKRSTAVFNENGRYIGSNVSQYQTTNDRTFNAGPVLGPALVPGPLPNSPNDANGTQSAPAAPAPAPTGPSASITTPNDDGLAPQDSVDQPRSVPTASRLQDQPN